MIVSAIKQARSSSFTQIEPDNCGFFSQRRVRSWKEGLGFFAGVGLLVVFDVCYERLVSAF